MSNVWGRWVLYKKLQRGSMTRGFSWKYRLAMAVFLGKGSLYPGSTIPAPFCVLLRAARWWQAGVRAADSCCFILACRFGRRKATLQLLFKLTKEEHGGGQVPPWRILRRRCNCYCRDTESGGMHGAYARLSNLFSLSLWAVILIIFARDMAYAATRITTVVDCRHLLYAR